MKTLILFLTAILSSAMLRAQDAKAIFTAEKMVFFGADFTQAKFAIPDAKPEEIKSKYIPLWSSTIMTDNERFNKESSFQKLTVYGDPTIADKRNATININAAMGKPAGPLSKETIQQVINEYKDGLRKEGVGLVILVESFSKKDDAGIADFVFFDVASRKVLLIKRLTGRPGGGGLNNFWARSISVMFEDISKTQFEVWKKEVMGK